VVVALESSRGFLDFSEAESELVAGQATEFSGAAFMVLVLAEYVVMLILMLLGVGVFCGGVLWLLCVFVFIVLMNRNGQIRLRIYEAIYFFICLCVVGLCFLILIVIFSV